MYVPAHFQPPGGGAPDQLRDRLGELLARVPLVDLITHGARSGVPGGLTATPLPVLYDADRGPLGTLVGHVARNHPHWQLARLPGNGGTEAPAPQGTSPDDPPDSLVIVHGPDAYISPTWYASTAAHGRVVPTWNYVTAHVHGHLIVHDDAEWTFQVVRRLTEHFEAGITTPWTVADPPEGFVAGQLRAIVGIEVRVTSIEAKYKLGQNRSDADVSGAITGLSAGTPSERALGGEMATLRSGGAGDPGLELGREHDRRPGPGHALDRVE